MNPNPEPRPAVSARKPRARVDRRTGSELIARLLAGNDAPAQLAAEMNVTLEALSHWARRPDVRETIRGLARLADMRAQLLVSGFRTNAAIHLMTLASGPEANELARKACADLLQLDLSAFDEGADGERADRHGASAHGAGAARAHDDAPMPGPPPPAMERAILRNLERLAQARNE